MTEQQDNTELERLYVIVELLSDGTRTIALLDEGNRKIAAVTGDLKTARSLIVRFCAQASERKFLLVEYVKCQDLMLLKRK